MKSRRIAVAFAVVASLAALVLFVSIEYQSDVLAEMLAAEDTGAWVSVLDPERAAPGYTLVLYRRRLPLLMDLEGRVVHSWPEVRAVSRARLSHHGDLLVISAKNRIESTTGRAICYSGTRFRGATSPITM